MIANANNYSETKVANIILIHMTNNKIRKKELSEYLNLSYPNILYKLKNPGKLSVDEFFKLLNYIDIHITDVLI
jgi:hypothetical protein